MSSKSLIRVGIAGLGRSGWSIHLLALEGMQDRYAITAVTDTKPERMEEARERVGCKTCSSFEELISDEDVELVVVATPSHLHPEHSINALNAGKDVVCEKPMATTVEDADRMIEASKKSGRTLAVFQNRRYEAGFMKMREVIESGILGRVVLIRFAVHGFGRRWDWQTLREFGGGSLNNTGPHFLDQALELLGDAEPEIFCHLERTLTSGDAEDHCKVILRAPGAPMIDLEITSSCAYPQDTYLVMGTSGGLTGNPRSLRWKYVDWSKMPPRPVDRSPVVGRAYNREELDWKEESWERPEDYPPEVFLFYRDLYETLRHSSPLVITPESVRRQVAILQKCHELCPVP